eukprot:204845_1
MATRANTARKENPRRSRTTSTQSKTAIKPTKTKSRTKSTKKKAKTTELVILMSIHWHILYDRIRKLITTHKINVISATDQYKSQKTSAFMNILRNKYSINKVISIGDSLQEYNDIETVCNVLRLRRRRIGANIINYYRYKLVDNPSLNTMIKQLNNIKQLNYFNIAKQRYDQSEQYKI